MSVPVTRVGAIATLLVAMTGAAPVGASGAVDNARSIADRALRASMGQPGCDGQVMPPVVRTTDEAPPSEVLRRYGIFRLPQPVSEPLAPLTWAENGLVASAYQRTRTVAGIRVSVAPLLDWTPSVRPRSCDAFALREVRALVRGQPRSVQRRAVAIVNQRVASDDAVRRLPPRTLLLIGAPDSPPPVTGALALSAQRGLFTQVSQATGAATFIGLVPDGVSRIRFRTTGQPDVEVSIIDNIAVARLGSDRLFGRGHQAVWLDAKGRTIRTIGRRTTRPG